MSILDKISQWPKWGKIVAGIGLVASILGILGFVFQISDIVSGSKQKREKFDATYKRAWDRMGSEFMSSHNYLISVIPNNIQTKSIVHLGQIQCNSD
jgi:hypothetical protein